MRRMSGHCKYLLEGAITTSVVKWLAEVFGRLTRRRKYDENSFEIRAAVLVDISQAVTVRPIADVVPAYVDKLEAFEMGLQLHSQYSHDQPEQRPCRPKTKLVMRKD